MKKRIMTLLLSLTLLLSACGSGGGKDVELTVPGSYAGEQTQEDLDQLREERGFASVTLNGDGSVTYVMSEKQHRDLMEEYKVKINEGLAQMAGSETYPNITGITANDDFTEFTVTTSSTEPDMAETFAVLAFYMYGGMYNVFNGKEAENITVNFVNADSGEIIFTSNSSDMGK